MPLVIATVVAAYSLVCVALGLYFLFSSPWSTRRLAIIVQAPMVILLPATLVYTAGESLLRALGVVRPEWDD